MSEARPGRGIDSAYAWRLALVSMACVALGGGGIYLPMVGLKEMAADFGDQRAVPSFAYMVGFFGMGVGGVFMGWLADRTSPRVPPLEKACVSSSTQPMARSTALPSPSSVLS